VKTVRVLFNAPGAAKRFKDAADKILLGQPGYTWESHLELTLTAPLSPSAIAAVYRLLTFFDKDWYEVKESVKAEGAGN
jgi:hypothetical protein